MPEAAPATDPPAGKPPKRPAKTPPPPPQLLQTGLAGTVPGRITGLGFTADAGHLVTTADDGSLRLWTVPPIESP